MKSMKALFSPRPDTPVGSRGFSTFSEAVVIVPHSGKKLENKLCPQAGHKILKYWASIVLSATYRVGADSISALFGGGYGIRPYNFGQTMIKAKHCRLFYQCVAIRPQLGD